MIPLQAALPKRERTQQRVKTQDELIRDALETEEENIASLNNFLTEEEERRARNTELRKTTIEPPLIRWISRPEKVKAPLIVEVELPPPTYNHHPSQTQLPGTSYHTNATWPSQTSFPAHSHPAYRQSSVTSSTTYTPPPGWRITGPPPKPVVTVTLPPPPQTSLTTALTETLPSTNTMNADTSSSGTPADGTTAGKSPDASAPAISLTTPAAPTTSSQTKAPTPLGTTAPHPKPKPKSAPAPMITQGRNLVILDTPGATPADDMMYLFGNHVDWGRLEVLPKIRPSSMFAIHAIHMMSVC